MSPSLRAPPPYYLSCTRFAALLAAARPRIGLGLGAALLLWCGGNLRSPGGWPDAGVAEGSVVGPADALVVRIVPPQ